MKILMVFSILSYSSYSQDVMELGNIDIKGNLNLPSYSLSSDILSMDSILKKVATIDFTNHSKINLKSYNVISIKEFKLTDSDDFNLDIIISKERLE